MRNKELEMPESGRTAAICQPELTILRPFRPNGRCGEIS
jgi:hypothetical protein